MEGFLVASPQSHLVAQHFFPRTEGAIRAIVSLSLGQTLQGKNEKMTRVYD
jgi:hypothetical protein